MTDVIERAKAALEGLTPGFWCAWSDNPFSALVPEFVAEIERLRGMNTALQVGQSNLQVLLSDAHAAVERLRYDNRSGVE